MFLDLDPRHAAPAFILALALLPACGGGGGSGSSDAATDTATGTDGTAASSNSMGPASDTDGSGESDSDTDGDTDGDESQQAPSAKARVKFKTAYRYAADLSSALGLPLSSVCLELSTYDCFETHRIALGEVDAYDSRIFEPLPEPPITAPIAVDRIALSACGEAVARDFGQAGQAELFTEVAGDPDAATEAERAAVTQRLYQRLLLREVDPHELDAVVGLYDELSGAQPAKTWAQLSCFAIATSLEALFY